VRERERERGGDAHKCYRNSFEIETKLDGLFLFNQTKSNHSKFKLK
jgi:hypothetical protein